MNPEDREDKFIIENFQVHEVEGHDGKGHVYSVFFTAAANHKMSGLDLLVAAAAAEAEETGKKLVMGLDSGEPLNTETKDLKH